MFGDNGACWEARCRPGNRQTRHTGGRGGRRPGGCRAGAGAAAAVYFWQRGFEQWEAGVPVLEDEWVPVGPQCPGRPEAFRRGVGGVVGVVVRVVVVVIGFVVGVIVVYVLAKANPVGGVDYFGDDVDVLWRESHHLFKADLSRHGRHNCVLNKVTLKLQQKQRLKPKNVVRVRLGILQTLQQIWQKNVDGNKNHSISQTMNKPQ